MFAVTFSYEPDVGGPVHAWRHAERGTRTRRGANLRTWYRDARTPGDPGRGPHRSSRIYDGFLPSGRRYATPQVGRVVDASSERSRLDAALSGDREAKDWMVARLQPVLQRTAGRLLMTLRGQSKGRATRQDLVDLTQDAWAILLHKEALALRNWDPNTGALEPYVARVVKNRLISKLRTKKHSPFTEDPTEADTLERILGMAEQFAQRVEDGDIVAKLLLQLREALSPLGQQVLDVFLMDGATVDDVMAETGLSKEAVRSWRKRIRNTAKQILADMGAQEAAS